MLCDLWRSGLRPEAEGVIAMTSVVRSCGRDSRWFEERRFDAVSDGMTDLLMLLDLMSWSGFGEVAWGFWRLTDVGLLRETPLTARALPCTRFDPSWRLESDKDNDRPTYLTEKTATSSLRYIQAVV